MPHDTRAWLNLANCGQEESYRITAFFCFSKDYRALIPTLSTDIISSIDYRKSSFLTYYYGIVEKSVFGRIILIQILNFVKLKSVVGGTMYYKRNNGSLKIVYLKELLKHVLNFIKWGLSIGKIDGKKPKFVHINRRKKKERKEGFSHEGIGSWNQWRWFCLTALRGQQRAFM